MRVFQFNMDISHSLAKLLTAIYQSSSRAISQQRTNRWKSRTVSENLSCRAGITHMTCWLWLPARVKPTSLKAVSAPNMSQWKWSTYITVSHLNTFADRGLISAKGTTRHFLSQELGFATIPVAEFATEGPQPSSFIWKWPHLHQQLLFWATVHI